MQIRIHRGTHEIGGSCVELEHDGSRIIVDLGMPIVKPGGNEGEKFDFRECEGKSNKELIIEGILPDIKGLYDEDNFGNIEGVLISHNHQDHYGLLNYVSPSIPIYIAEVSKKIIDISSIFAPLKINIQNYKTITAGKEFRCGNFEIIPYLADHDAFNAFSFHIKAGNKSILYTGDFRDHGRKKGTLDYMIDKLADSIDAVLLEGTMLGREDEPIQTEEEIEEKISRIILNNTNKLILIYTSGQNIDRIVSIYRAVKKTGRQLVLDVYAASILSTIAEESPYGKHIPIPSLEFPEIRVFTPMWMKKDLKKKGLDSVYKKFNEYKISVKEIIEQPDRFVMFYRSSLINDFKCINNRYMKMDTIPFIYSMWEGYYNDDEWKKTKDFIEESSMKLEMLHTSGHAYPKTLHKLIDGIKPKSIIPIHTFHPERYEQFGERVINIKDNELFII